MLLRLLRHKLLTRLLDPHSNLIKVRLAENQIIRIVKNHHNRQKTKVNMLKVLKILPLAVINQGHYYFVIVRS